jgi:hypothetical protein
MSFEPYLHSGLSLPSLYQEYGLPVGIKFPCDGADTFPGVNLCNHRKLLLIQYWRVSKSLSSCFCLRNT